MHRGTMRRTVFFVFASLPLIFVVLQLSQAQYNGQQVQARNSIPDMITGCYSNFSAYNRYNRRPMHIENLIGIIRKIEDKTDMQWDARRIARTLVHRYMYDGMQFFGDAKVDFRYRQEPEERAKSMIVKELIPLQFEESLPDGILDNDEKCSLHWMLSHALNGTIREEELFPGTGYPGSGSGYPGSGSGYPGNNNGAGNPLYNNNNNNGYNNNNNNNGFVSNNNNNNFNNNNNNNGNVPNNMGNNYNRGKRDISGATKENGTFDFSKATNDSMEHDTNSYEQDDYEAAEKKASSPNSQPKSVEIKTPDHDDDVADDVDVLHLQNDDSSQSGSSKSAKQISQDGFRRKTKRPVETGVVYTKWGGVAAGRLLSGIAAGLQLTQMSVYSGVVQPMQGSMGGQQPWSSGSGIAQPGNNGNNGFGSAGSGSGSWNGNNGVPTKSIVGNNNNNGYQYPGQPQQQQPPAGQRWSGRKKRQVQNLQPLDSIYAVTLSGDAGQAAILNAHNEIRSNALPSGEFNDTICPREFLLYEQYSGEIYKDSTTWTYLTEAEVRGGLDGFILGANMARWDPSSTLRLSDVLSQYYSDQGIPDEPNFRACERSSLMNSYVDGTKLKEQTRSFAYLYNNRTNVISDQKFISNPNLFEDIVTEAFDRMSGAARSFSSIGPCGPNSPGGSGTNDDNKNIIPKLTVYGVIDHSATVQEIDEQKRFFGQLAYELNVSPTGSRLGLVDGNSGSIIISPNWTDSSSTLACRTIQLNSQMKTQDYTRVLTNMKTELERVKSEELRNNFTMSNGIIILLMIQGRKLDEPQRDEIVRLTREINSEAYDITVVTASTKYSDTELGFAEDDQQIRHIRLNQGQGNLSSMATEFAKSLLRNTHGALRYMQCDSSLYDQDQEHLTPQHLYLDPNTIVYYKISPEYFHRGRAMVLRFTSFNGKVRICLSRKEWYPNSQNQENSRVDCKETTGNYIEVGRSETDVEFKGGDFNKPCGKHGKKSDCDPIYISVTPIEYRSPGQVGLDCSMEPCQSSNQVRVTFTHWDMRCDGVRSVLSSTVAFITLSLALFNWLKST